MGSAVERLIQKLRTIGDLSQADEALLRGMPVRIAELRKGAIVVADGEVSSRSCLVLDGFMHREKLTPAGGRQILSFHPAGDIPDLQSLHLKKMDYNLVATTECRVAFIEHRDLNAALQKSASLTGLMWRDSLIDAASFRAWMLMLGQGDADERMAHLFCEMFMRLRAIGLARGTTFQFPVTQIEIADALGISTVHANRTLQELRARGLITVERFEVTILDWAALKELAAFDPAYLHFTDENAGK